MSESEAVATEQELPGSAPEAVTEAPSIAETLGDIYDKVQEDAPSEGPARDTQGRFAGKNDAQAANAAAGEPDDPAIAVPPQSWAAQMREKWSTLSPDVRRYVAEREAETHRRITEQGQEVAKLKQLDEVVAPYRQAFNLAGVQEAAALRQVLETQALLQRDPVNGLRWIAQQFGVTADQLVQMVPQPRQLAPEAQALWNEVQQLKAANAAQQAQQQQAMQTGLQAEIAEFSKDRPHFEAVREKMGQLIGSQVASGLADAYEMAILAVPEIRQQVLAEERKAALAEQEKARQAESAKRAAAVNVRGGSAPGAGAAPRSMRETMLATYDRLNAAS